MGWVDEVALVEGRRVHFMVGPGSGPTLVVSPGITSPAATWLGVGARLSAHARVVLVDNPGRGLSDLWPSYRLEDYAEAIEAVIAAVADDRPTLLGHSMGARIAAVVAVRNRCKLASVIMADPPMSGPGRDPYPVPLEHFTEPMRLVRDGALEQLCLWHPRLDGDGLAARAEALRACCPTAVVASWNHFHDEDFLVWFDQIAIPATLIYGEESNVVSSQSVTELSSRNPAVARRGVPHAGHLIPFDNPDGFTAAVVEALDRDHAAAGR